MLKIALLSDTMAATHSDVSGHGLGRANWNLATALHNYGHEVTLFGAPGSSFAGRTIISSGVGQRYEPELAYAAYHLYKKGEFDVLIEANHKHPLSGLFADIPVLNFYHDKWQPKRRNAVLMSEGQRALMDDDFSSAKVIHHQLDARSFLPSYRADNPPYALFVGFIYKWKQPILAIEAAARFGMKLIVAGQLQEGLEALDTPNNNCQWIGAQHPNAIKTLMRGAAVYLQLGDHESFGLTSVEAGLSGCPTVAWPSGGNLDTVRDGANGAFVNLDYPDKVNAVCEAMQRAIRLPRHCVREYTEKTFGQPGKQVEQIEQLCEAVIRGENW